MKKNYFKLILVMMVAAFCFAATTVKAQETMKYDSEAKKLEFIRQMLSKEKYLRSSEYNAPHCKQMMKDLLAGKNFKAIEPYMRADSADDPRLSDWQQCEDKELSGVLIFESLYQLGAPPYRFYKIEIGEKKQTGPKDVVYHNMRKGAIQGNTGYTWVDWNNSELKDGYTVTGALESWSKKPNAVYLNTIVYYKGKLWLANFVDGFGFSLTLMKWLDKGNMETCRWMIFQSEEEEKEYYKTHQPIKTNNK